MRLCHHVKTDLSLQKTLRYQCNTINNDNNNDDYDDDDDDDDDDDNNNNNK